MHKNVEAVIGRLATDPALLRRFAGSPAAVLEELCAQGLELTPVEREALAATDAEALRCFAGSLDRRLRRAPLTDANASRGGVPETNPPLEKENDR
jgi:hypothetical protein